jgi:predicted TPR repeat methyltransferase
VTQGSPLQNVMVTITEAFASALEYLQAGQLQAAEQIYRQILAIDPQQAPAWHALGLIAHQAGQYLDAEMYLRRSLVLDPNLAPAHNNLGVTLQAQQRLAEAADCYGRALQVSPAYVKAHYNLGVVLTEQGKLSEAAACYRRVLEFEPQHADAHNNLGNAFQSEGKPDEAAACYRRALERRPDFAEAHNNLGNVLRSQGIPDQAVACYRRALELHPEFAAAHNNLGNALKDQGKLPEAIACYRRATEIEPDFAEAQNHLAIALFETGQIAEAVHCWQACLSNVPEHAVARHMIAANTGRNVPARAADEYIRGTFDSFAAHYEQTLARLDYRMPEMIASAAARALGDAHGNLDILDAGCGTGLCGLALRPYARHLTGVDLSPAMLDKARARQIYDSLVLGELTEHFNLATESYDLITAADTLIYFGDLHSVLAAVVNALRRNGRLIFTVEHACDSNAESRGFLLQSHGRYCHTESYVRRSLELAGLILCDLTHVVLRTERGEPVQGMLISCEKDSPARPRSETTAGL